LNQLDHQVSIQKLLDCILSIGKKQC